MQIIFSKIHLLFYYVWLMLKIFKLCIIVVNIFYPLKKHMLTLKQRTYVWKWAEIVYKFTNTFCDFQGIKEDVISFVITLHIWFSSVALWHLNLYRLYTWLDIDFNWAGWEGPNNLKLAARIVLKLLAPTFSEEGSTAYLKKK